MLFPYFFIEEVGLTEAPRQTILNEIEKKLMLRDEEDGRVLDEILKPRVWVFLEKKENN
jgi:hypothetical protein